MPSGYELAKTFAESIRDEYPGYTVVLTGHSLGGAEASYAAGKLGLNSYVFNAARNNASEMNDGANQTVFFTRGDAVGDPSGIGGLGALRGATYELDPEKRSIDPTEQVFGAHDLKGILDSLLTTANSNIASQ